MLTYKYKKIKKSQIFFNLIKPQYHMFNIILNYLPYFN